MINVSRNLASPRSTVRLRSAAALLAATACLVAAWASPVMAAPPARAAAATSAPTIPAPSPSGCYAVLFTGRWYCAASVSGLQARAYAPGQRIVLRGVSVMSRTSSTVTVAALEAAPCPPDRWCGASFTLYRHTLAWTGSSRPVSGDVIDLFGISTGTSLTPVGYVLNRTACHVNWC